MSPARVPGTLPVTIRLHHNNINRLLLNPSGPVGRDIVKRAMRVTAQAHDNVANIMHRKPEVADQVGFSLDERLVATIGIRPHPVSGRKKSIAQYLADKEVAEIPFRGASASPWLVSALAQTWKKFPD